MTTDDDQSTVERQRETQNRSMPSFRLDRLITLYLIRPFRSKITTTSGRTVPILMYHSISDAKETSHPYYRVNTSPAQFNAQMRYLHENHYTVISLGDLPECLNTDNPSKYVVITFDDGFHDFYSHAYPILNRYGFSATVFLPTGFIHNDRLAFKEKACLTWNEVRQLSNAGILFGSHTVSHPLLKILTEDEIEYELQSSRETIENETGIAVESFSHPFAFPEGIEYRRMLKRRLEKCGYRNGVTTLLGVTRKGDDLYFQPRLPVNSDDDLAFFQAKLQGAYDWLARPQSVIKRLKGFKHV